MKVRIFGALAAAAFVLGVSGGIPAEAEAQLAERARPRFGAVQLDRGFMPDPHVLTGQGGGPVSASQIDSRCRGYLSPAPNHVVRTRSGFQQIRFVVNSQVDTTLVVRLPNGQYICDDDGGEGLNALVSTASPRGDIRIWVGTYSASAAGSPYQLGVTELGHVTASSLSGGGGVAPPPQHNNGLAANARPAHGQTSLARGFMPDPHIVSGQAGGPVDARSLGGVCRGYITSQPGHVIMSRTGFSNLRFVVNSGRLDTTLVVMLPDGRFVCDDDGGDRLNPLVVTAAPPGPIRIWVGSYSSSGTGPYNMGYSELGRVGTSSIPEPGGGAVAVPIPQPQQPQQPQQPPPNIVQMDVNIPITLFGPGMDGNTVAMWNPRGASAVEVRLQGRNLVAQGVTLGTIPPSMQDVVVTVTSRRDGTLLVRAEQPPGPGEAGEQMLMLVRWAGRPTVGERWTGSFRQRPPRWAR